MLDVERQAPEGMVHFVVSRLISFNE